MTALRIKHTPGAIHAYTATMRAVGTYGFGNTPDDARTSFEHQMAEQGRCPRCARVSNGWPLKRSDVCAPPSWARCIRNL